MKLFYTEDREVSRYVGYDIFEKQYVREYYLLGALLHRRVKSEPWE